MWDIDFLTITYLNPDKESGFTSIEKFLEAFPAFKDAFFDSPLKLGNRYYDFMFDFLDGEHKVFVYYSNKLSPIGKDMGVNIQFSGSALYLFKDLLGFDLKGCDLFDLCYFLYSNNFQISRIDLKYDDFEKKYNPTYYIDKFREKKLVTNFKGATYFTSAQSEGDTFALGKRKTGKYLRIYDKNYESKGEINAVRYEFELHSRYAKAFMENILNGVEFDFFKYLSEEWFYIISRPKEECGKNYDFYRDKDWDSWIKSSFAKSIDEFKLSPKRRKPSIEDSFNYLTKHLNSFFLQIKECYGIDAIVDACLENAPPDWCDSPRMREFTIQKLAHYDF